MCGSEKIANKEEFKKLLLEAGFKSNVELSYSLNISNITVNTWVTKCKYPAYLRIALQWAKFAREYDRISDSETIANLGVNSKEQLQTLQDENRELKKELAFLYSLREEMKRKLLNR